MWLVSAMMGCGGDTAMTQGMDAMPPGDGPVCLPTGAQNGYLWIRLSCEPGDGGSNGVCEGSVGSSNARVGFLVNDPAEISIPENTTEDIWLDYTAWLPGEKADVVVYDSDCVGDTPGCTVFPWNCPQCAFPVLQTYVADTCP